MGIRKVSSQKKKNKQTREEELSRKGQLSQVREELKYTLGFPTDLGKITFSGAVKEGNFHATKHENISLPPPLFLLYCNLNMSPNADFLFKVLGVKISFCLLQMNNVF